jgi:hypothetical protein
MAGDGAGETSAAPAAMERHVFGGPAVAAATERWVFFGCGRQLIRVDPRTGSVRVASAPRSKQLPSTGA